MIRMSNDARRVIRWLSEYSIDLNIRQQFALEVDLLHFFPNHIRTVIKKVLSGKNLDIKIGKARTLGWDYFHQPVDQLLGKRIQARRSYLTVDNMKWASKVYSIVVTTFVDSDFNYDEAVMLLTEIPPMLLSRDDTMKAISICKRNDVRTIPYLRAVLVREDARRETRRRERERQMAARKPWQPQDDIDVVEAIDRSLAWKERQKEAKIKRELSDASKRYRRD